MSRALWAAALLWASPAFAETDPDCLGEKPADADYNEFAQVAFIQNYIALATSFSPVHAPVPHEGGHGAVGVELAVMPPLSCARRFALGRTKTEDTNKSPVVPRPRVTFAFPGSDKIIPYAGVGFVPPVPVGGVRTTIVSAEAGVGVKLGEALQVGGRFHATSVKNVGDTATAFAVDEVSAVDIYVANTMGLDLMAGYAIEDVVTPYVAFGIMDATTFFWIGDDGVVSNNLFPYMGPTFSIGADGLTGPIRWGAEFYGAPGGYTQLHDSFEREDGQKYGSIMTARFRVGYEF
jgi:hypothetical protein